MGGEDNDKFKKNREEKKGKEKERKKESVYVHVCEIERANKNM